MMAASGNETDGEGDGGEKRWDWWSGVTTAIGSGRERSSRLAEEENECCYSVIFTDRWKVYLFCF
jgi:hypothetical protein